MVEKVVEIFTKIFQKNDLRTKNFVIECVLMMLIVFLFFSVIFFLG
jgi:hypothetical protein